MKKKGRRLVERDTKGERIKTHTPKTDEYLKQKPAFSLEYMGVRGYCVSDCDTTQKSSLVDALFLRSQLTWQQLKNEPRDRLGYEILSDPSLNNKLRSKAKKKLSEDDRLKVFRVKTDTKMRMIGHRVDHIFYILLFDRKGDLYDHG